VCIYIQRERDTHREREGGRQTERVVYWIRLYLIRSYLIGLEMISVVFLVAPVIDLQTSLRPSGASPLPNSFQPEKGDICFGLYKSKTEFVCSLNAEFLNWLQLGKG